MKPFDSTKPFKWYFDQPTHPVLQELKYLLRVLQARGFTREKIRFLLTLESVLEKGDPNEALRIKLLRVLQDDTELEN